MARVVIILVARFVKIFMVNFVMILVVCFCNNTSGKFCNNIFIYLTLCTFSFEINESSLSDTRCLIQDVVSQQAVSEY